MRALIFLLCLLSLLVVGCAPKAAGGGEEETSEISKKEDLSPTMEARQYFADPKARFWTEGPSVDDLKNLTNSLYSAGAPEVFVGDVSDWEGYLVSAIIGAKMPSDKAARTKVLEAWNKVFAEYEGEPETDSGQEIIWTTLD